MVVASPLIDVSLKAVCFETVVFQHSSDGILAAFSRWPSCMFLSAGVLLVYFKYGVGWVSLSLFDLSHAMGWL